MPPKAKKTQLLEYWIIPQTPITLGLSTHKRSLPYTQMLMSSPDHNAHILLWIYKTNSCWCVFPVLPLVFLANRSCLWNINVAPWSRALHYTSSLTARGCQPQQELRKPYRFIALPQESQMLKIQCSMQLIFFKGKLSAYFPRNGLCQPRKLFSTHRQNSEPITFTTLWQLFIYPEW